MPVKPPPFKYTKEDLGDKLVVSISSARHWFIVFFLAFFLILVVIGELAFSAIIITNRNHPDWFSIGFMIVIMIGWAVGGGFMIYQLAWQISGKEVVEVTVENITISRVALGFRSQKEYSATHVKELRASSSNMNLNHPMFWWAYYSYYPLFHTMIGSLAFDYGAKTFRFGMSVDEAEAKQIIAEIQQKFPQYRSGSFSRA